MVEIDNRMKTATAHFREHTKESKQMRSLLAKETLPRSKTG